MTTEQRMHAIGSKMLTTGMTLREYYIGQFPTMDMVEDILHQLAEWEEANVPEQPVTPKPFNPDWTTAPTWAQWWAVDADGIAYYFEEIPKNLGEFWASVNDVKSKKDRICPDLAPIWRETLTKRP